MREIVQSPDYCKSSGKRFVQALIYILLPVSRIKDLSFLGLRRIILKKVINIYVKKFGEFEKIN